MTLLPEVRTTLMSAAEARAATGTKMRWPHLSVRTGGLAVLGVAVAGTAAAATSVWSPQLGDQRRGTPSQAAGPLQAAQVASLAVLRRPQSAADRGPEVLAALKLLSGHDDGGIHLDGVRLLRRSAGSTMVLIPQDRLGSRDPGYASSVRSDVLVLHYARRVPRSVATVHRPDGERQRVVHPAGMVTALTSGTARQLRDHGIVNIARVGSGWRVYGLVPDGVAKVQLLEATGAGPAAAVRGNAFDVLAASSTQPAPRLRWLDRKGRTVGGS